MNVGRVSLGNKVGRASNKPYAEGETGLLHKHRVKVLILDLVFSNIVNSQRLWVKDLQDERYFD